MMKKKTKIILSSLYGLLLTGLTAFLSVETFLIPSSSGTLANEQHAFDFDDDSSSEGDSGNSGQSGDATGESTGDNTGGTSENTGGSADDNTGEGESGGEETPIPAAATTLTYEENTYSVSNKKVPYMLVTVNLKKISDLRTRVATNSTSNYGTNITESFSSLISDAEQSTGDEVLFAIDGDFPFWSGRNGYVVRNGSLLRSSRRSDSSNLDLAIYKDGTFSAYDEKNVAADTLMSQNNGCYQNWSFGPALLADSEIKVTQNQDVSQSMSANQRVAMGYKDDGTLYFLCSNTNDGQRRNSSVGLSLYNMATIFQGLGCSLAYNFDGGGSANMYIKGYGSSNYYMKQSRALGDIVYVVNS